MELYEKYYEGKPCGKCGSTVRWKSNRSCVDCHRVRSNERRQEGFYKRIGVTKEYIESIDSGCCDICGKAYVKADVDHCHTTGKFRGLLCGECNKGLGLFYDNIDTLNRAIKYLEIFNGTS